MSALPPHPTGVVAGRLLAATLLVVGAGLLLGAGQPDDRGLASPAAEERSATTDRQPGGAAAEEIHLPAALLLDRDRGAAADDAPRPTRPRPDVGAGDRAASVALGQETSEGFRVLEGDAAAGTGETHTFTLEVAPELRGRAQELDETARAALLDEERSWARDRRLVQVTDPDEADVRVVLAEPPTVDERCLEAGLETAGVSSCWDGQRAMLNADRWRGGVDHVDDLATYRTYLVNHEVGHALGRSHQSCPGPGEPAPVMMQQTMRLDACEPNAWPHP